jgi:hypothetical protein
LEGKALETFIDVSKVGWLQERRKEEFKVRKKMVGARGKN